MKRSTKFLVGYIDVYFLTVKNEGLDFVALTGQMEHS